MFDSNGDYDGGVNTFSPQGRILQVEYAMKAVNNGSTIIGVHTKEGVVLGVEKRLDSPLVEPSSVEKIHKIDGHLCAASCGVVSDARVLIDKARVESQNHYFTYNEIISTYSIAQTVGDTILGFGKGDDMPSRPFGVAILIAGCDNDHGPKLFLADPAGSFSEWKAKALGSGAESAQGELEEKWKPDLTLAQGKELVLSVLKNVLKEEVNAQRVELAIVAPHEDELQRLHMVPEEELTALLVGI